MLLIDLVKHRTFRMKFCISHCFLFEIFLLTAINWCLLLHVRAEQISSNSGDRDPRMNRNFSPKMKILASSADKYEQILNSTLSTESELTPPANLFVTRQILREFSEECPDDKQNIMKVISADNVIGYSLNKQHLKLLNKFSPDTSRELTEGCASNTESDCTDKAYPNINGTCNNLKRKTEGMRNSCILNLLPADYRDGQNESRVTKCGELPFPLDINNAIYIKEKCIEDGSYLSAMLPVFGQFIERDILSTAVINNYDGSRYFKNEVTAAIDGSFIYGIVSNEKTKEQIRNTMENLGKLRTYNRSTVGELPDSHKLPPDSCNPDYPCFLTGVYGFHDSLPLASLHITFFRMHNLIADKLKEANPTWDDETLFQEARLINMFIIQNIIFKEYLPLIVGQKYVDKYQLDKNVTEYNCSIPLGILSSFFTTVVIIRATLPDDIYVISEFGLLSILPRNDTYSDMEYIHEHDIEDIIRGATKQYRKSPPHLLKSIKDKNYYSSKFMISEMYNAREFEIPSYVYYVFYLHGIRVKNFHDLFYYELMDIPHIEILEKLYKCVEDIDLIVGLLCEKDYHTFSTIVSLQYRRLKIGSRFIYTHKAMLPRSQRELILKVKFSHVFCYVTDMPQIAENVFDTRSPIIRCDQIPPLNLTAWKRQPNSQ